MELRRVQRTVDGSYIITLPAKWISAAGVVKGDFLQLIPKSDGSLRLAPNRRSSKRPAESSLNADEPMTALSLMSCYAIGSDTIKIHSGSTIGTKRRSELKEQLSKLIGIEVVEEFSDSITTQIMVDTAKFNHDTLLSHYTTSAIAVLNDVAKALRSGDKVLAEDAYHRGMDIVKIYRLMLRQLVTACLTDDFPEEIGVRGPVDALIRAVVGRDVNRLTYHATRAAFSLVELSDSKLDDGMREKMADLSKMASEMTSQARAAFHNGDLAAVSSVIGQMRNVRPLHDEIALGVMKTSLEPANKILLLRLARDIRTVAGHAVGIAEVAVLRANLEKLEVEDNRPIDKPA